MFVGEMAKVGPHNRLSCFGDAEPLLPQTPDMGRNSFILKATNGYIGLKVHDQGLVDTREMRDAQVVIRTAYTSIISDATLIPKSVNPPAFEYGKTTQKMIRHHQSSGYIAEHGQVHVQVLYCAREVALKG